MEPLDSINVLLRRRDPLRLYPIAARVSAILIYLGHAHVVVRVLILAHSQRQGYILTGAALYVSILWDHGEAIRWRQLKPTSSIASLPRQLTDP